jgi:hypothetical protein
MTKFDDKRNAGPPNATEHGKNPSPNTFDGKIVSMTGDKLVMRNKDGKEYTHTLAKDARLTCDGTACKADELRTGDRIRVTTKKDDRNVATGVESLNKKSEFSQAS